MDTPCQGGFQPQHFLLWDIVKQLGRKTPFLDFPGEAEGWGLLARASLYCSEDIVGRGSSTVLPIGWVELPGKKVNNYTSN